MAAASKRKVERAEPTLRVTAAAWHAWLAKHHASATAVLLVITKQGVKPPIVVVADQAAGAVARVAARLAVGDLDPPADIRDERRRERPSATPRVLGARSARPRARIRRTVAASTRTTTTNATSTTFHTVAPCTIKNGKPPLAGCMLTL